MQIYGCGVIPWNGRRVRGACGPLVAVTPWRDPQTVAGFMQNIGTLTTPGTLATIGIAYAILKDSKCANQKIITARVIRVISWPNPTNANRNKPVRCFST